MTKKAFINPLGVLTCWGYVESNGSNTSVSVDDDFSLEPGKWKLTEGAWVAWPITPPTPLQQIRALEQAQPIRDAMERANRLASFVVAKTELVRQQAAKSPPVIVTHEQAHTFLYAYDKPYKLLWDLEQTVAPIRSQIV